MLGKGKKKKKKKKEVRSNDAQINVRKQVKKIWFEGEKNIIFNYSVTIAFVWRVSKCWIILFVFVMITTLLTNVWCPAL